MSMCSGTFLSISLEPGLAQSFQAFFLRKMLHRSTVLQIVPSLSLHRWMLQVVAVRPTQGTVFTVTREDLLESLKSLQQRLFHQSVNLYSICGWCCLCLVDPEFGDCTLAGAWTALEGHVFI